jgi:hypothetical protein
MKWIILNWPNASSRTVALGSTQPLTEKSTRNVPGGKERQARKADNLVGPQRLTTLWPFMACYRNSLPYLYYLNY